eukprot:TRINITY_DN609_c0_g1_i4.p1 TRINITY_DN609_c0_g1~~TRINITY_DN609_c0_g1_i4.p1  ORF type:complete len:389 (+),score=56.47 TRINITY_DN609_c0_g1_i4:81-1247(+)
MYSSNVLPILALLSVVFFTISSAYLFPKNVTEIILGYGYPCENHHAPTSDGWILSMQRIPHGRTNTKATKGPVLIQHGLTDSSVGFCLNSPTESLPYILADLGYDVWLGNNRGNGVSMTNINYTPDQAEFWDFSWDEMALYDFPSQINYVLRVTGQSKLSYVGHSEGTIQAFAGLIHDNSLADKIKVYIALAPVAYVTNVEVAILRTLAALDAVLIFEVLGIREFSLPLAIEKFVPDICKIDPSLCDFVLKILTGPFAYLNESRSAYYLTYEPNPTSVKNIIHWSQGVRTRTYQMFDYGTVGNLKHYNQATPPQYKIGNFPAKLPLALFTGGQDYLADPADVQTLINDLPTTPYVHNQPTYGHLDPLFGYHADVDIYPRVVTLLAQYN